MDRLAADRMFVQVVRMGGFSAAAARAGVSPGQASKLVSRLESHLGLRLLTRTTRAISLTPEGEAYLASIATILDQLDDLDDSLRDAAANPSGLLRLTAPLTFGTVQLMPALNDFARAHPAVTLQVDFTDDIVSLAQQGVDLAIRAGQPRDSTLVGRKLAVMRIQVVAAPAYLAAHGTPQRPEDLRGHAIITDLNFAHASLVLPSALARANDSIISSLPAESVLRLSLWVSPRLICRISASGGRKDGSVSS